MSCAGIRKFREQAIQLDRCLAVVRIINNSDSPGSILSLCQHTAFVFQYGTERENQRYVEGGGQRRGHDTDGPIGMIGNHAVGDRRKPAGANDARVEKRESAADVAFWRKVWDGCIQYRRGTVENDTEKRKDCEHWREREYQGRYHQQCR